MRARAFLTALLLVTVLLALSGCGGGASSGASSAPAQVAAVDESGPPASAAVQNGGPPSSTLASGPSTRAESSAIAPRAAGQRTLVAQFSSDRWVMAGLGNGAAGWAEFFAVDLTSSSRNPDGSPSCLIASNDAWARIPSSAYQAALSAPTYTCSGDLDGDGRDELVIGTGDAGHGTVYVYRPTSSGFVSVASVSLTDFPAYTDSAQAPSYPACVDIDGDGRAELVVGTGPAGQGFAQIFRYDATTRTFSPLTGTPYAHGYVRVAWTQYTGSGNAPVFPAGGWLKGRGTGKTQQLVLGLGSTGQGWMQLWTWDGNALVPWTAGGSSWLQVGWSAYNQSGDAPTYPAVGDLDGDGFDDLVVGLGDRSAGWLQVFRSSGSTLASNRWMQVDWSSYVASGRAPTHPAVGDIDGDGKADIVVGLGDVGKGWMWVVRGTARSWSQVQWGTYTSSAVAPTWPSIGRGAVPSVTALQITPTISSMPVGTKQAFVATATLSDGTTVDASQTVAWSSSNAAVLSVSAGGGVTAASPGPATVSAKLGTKTAALALTVTPATLVSMAVSPNPASIFTGSTRAFTATGVYTDGSHVDVTAQATWASDVGAVAFSGAAGVASGVSAGSANVSASLNGSTGTAACTVVDPRLVSIAVSGDATSLPLGVRQAMHATGAFEDGSYRDVTSLVIWSSSDATRVSVSASGEATSVALGTSTVRATFGLVVGSLDITATAAALSSLQVSPLAPSLPQGLTQQLTATGVYTDGTQADLTDLVTWQSSDASVTVSNANGSRGLATAASKGSATVTATLGGKSGQATVTVIDAEIQSLEVSPTTADVPLGLMQALVATAVYTDGSRLTVTTDATWSSTDATTVAVSNQGVVTSLKTGTVTIAASLSGKQATATVTASAPVLQQVQVTPASPSLAKGLEQQFQATGVYSDTSTHDLTDSVTWSTSDGSLASISNAAGSAGLLRALATGSVTVTATLDGKSGTASLTVTPAVVSSVVVSPATVSLPQGVDRQLTATAHLSDGTTSDVTSQATWTTDDETIAVCSTTDPTRGLLHAVAAGATTAKATLSAKTGSATVTVTTPALQRIDVTAPATSLPKGVQTQCTATGVYDNGTHADLTSQATWTTTDSGLISVSIGGLATGAGTGTATIKASFGGVEGTLDFTGTAALLTSIAVTPSAPSIAMGLTVNLTATGTYSDATQADLTDQVTWTSADGSVAVSNAGGSHGVATGVSTGSAQVSATQGGVSGAASVTVTPAVLVGLEVTPAAPSIPKALTQQLTATAVYSDATRVTMTSSASWQTTDASIASVSTTGLVTSVSPGSVTVTATYGGQQATASVIATAASLLSIQVSAGSQGTPIVPKGQSLQLTATGSFSDGTQGDATSLVDWSCTPADRGTMSGAVKGLFTCTGDGDVTVTAAAPAGSPSAGLTVHANGFVIVYLPGPSTSQKYALKVDTTTDTVSGFTSLSATITVGLVMVADPDGRYLYDDWGNAFTIDASTGILAQAASGYSGYLGIALDTVNGIVYRTGFNPDQLLRLQSTPSGGVLPSAGNPTTAPKSAAGVTTSLDGHYVYASGLGKVAGYTALGVDLMPLTGSPWTVGTTPVYIKVHPNGRWMYVINEDSGDVHGFEMASNGTLSALPGSPYTVGSASGGRSRLYRIAIPVTGTRAFVAHFYDGLYEFDIDPSTGALQQAGSAITSGYDNSAWGAWDIAFDASGTYLIAGLEDRARVSSTGRVAIWRYDATQGNLTPLSGSPWTVPYSQVRLAPVSIRR